MKCSFCNATNVKLNPITYDGKPSLVCFACIEFDGIKGDK